jgi:DNA mismatch repair ATPase MutS
LEVAKIAWIQKWIISEAKKMISRHQIIWLPAEQMSISELWINNIYCNSELESYLESLDITTLTPLDSLNCLAKIKKLSEK